MCCCISFFPNPCLPLQVHCDHPSLQRYFKQSSMYFKSTDSTARMLGESRLHPSWLWLWASIFKPSQPQFLPSIKWGQQQKPPHTFVARFKPGPSWNILEQCLAHGNALASPAWMSPYSAPGTALGTGAAGLNQHEFLCSRSWHAMSFLLNLSPPLVTG